MQRSCVNKISHIIEQGERAFSTLAIYHASSRGNNKGKPVWKYYRSYSGRDDIFSKNKYIFSTVDVCIYACTSIGSGLKETKSWRLAVTGKGCRNPQEHLVCN